MVYENNLRFILFISTPRQKSLPQSCVSLQKGEKFLRSWGPSTHENVEIPTQISQLKFLEAGTCLFLGSEFLRTNWATFRSESWPEGKYLRKVRTEYWYEALGFQMHAKATLWCWPGRMRRGRWSGRGARDRSQLWICKGSEGSIKFVSGHSGCYEVYLSRWEDVFYLIVCQPVLQPSPI